MQKNLFNLKLVAVLAVVLLMVFGVAGTALAASPQKAEGEKQGLFGTVTAKGESSFTLTTKEGTNMALTVNADTKFRVPGKADASFADISVGSRVAVLAQFSGSSLVALGVMALPSEPQREHITLTVTDISGNTLTAEDSLGNKITVELDHEVSADLKGVIVTFIGEKSAQSNRFKANAEVKINNIIDRLEAHAKKVEAEAKVEANARIKAEKEKQAADLKARLEANIQKHLDQLSEVIDKAPESARIHLQAALEASRKGFQRALEQVGEARADVEVKLRLRALEGTVDSVDSAAGTVTVSSERDAKVTVKVTADTKIQVGDTAGTLADITAGSHVAVRYNSETMEAAGIVVKTKAEAKGKIQSIDTANGKIVIVLDNGASLMLNLTSQTQIKINGKDATAGDLKANIVVGVVYDLRNMNILTLRASTMAEVSGVIKTVDQANGTITIQTKAGTEITLKVPATTPVKIHGLLYGLQGLSAEMQVQVKYDLTTGAAVEIAAKSESERGRLGAEANAHVSGTVASINPATGEVTVSLPNGGTITIRGNARIFVDGNGEQLSVGDKIKVEYDKDSKAALKVEAVRAVQAQAKAAAGVQVYGVIKSLDAAGHKMVLQLKDGSSLELNLDGHTVIRISGHESTAADLKVGMNVEVGYRQAPDLVGGKLALRINTSGQLENEAAGIVDSVDAANHKVVIVLRNSVKLELSVNADTVVRINGQSGSAAGLKQGMKVEVRYRADTNVTLKINAASPDKSGGISGGSQTSSQVQTNSTSGGTQANSSANATTSTTVNSNGSAESKTEIKVGISTK